MPVQLYNGDCLAIMPELAPQSVDLVLTDLPFGTTACAWDQRIDLGRFWAGIKRCCKSNAAIVLNASQPFTTILGASNLPWLRYSWVWEKTRPTNFLQVKRMPLKGFEDVLVFYGSLPTYNPQGVTPVCRTMKNSGTKGRTGSKKLNGDQPYHGTVRN